MKKVFLAFLIFLIAGFYGVKGLSGINQENSSSVTSGQTLGEQALADPTPTLVPAQGGLPKTLIIPKLNIKAAVEHVGMDNKGAMDVPKNSFNVAWYKLGHKTGSMGSAVLAGHFDRVDGSPAVFYRLEELEIGDEIKVFNEDGIDLTYKVTRKEVYDFDKVPLQEIFDSKDKARLNLITCEGVFNKTSRNYSKRLVIFSELQNP